MDTMAFETWDGVVGASSVMDQASGMVFHVSSGADGLTNEVASALGT